MRPSSKAGNLVVEIPVHPGDLEGLAPSPRPSPGGGAGYSTTERVAMAASTRAQGANSPVGTAPSTHSPPIAQAHGSARNLSGIHIGGMSGRAGGKRRGGFWACLCGGGAGEGAGYAGSDDLETVMKKQKQEAQELRLSKRLTSGKVGSPGSMAGMMSPGSPVKSIMKHSPSRAAHAEQQQRALQPSWGPSTSYTQLQVQQLQSGDSASSATAAGAGVGAGAWQKGTRSERSLMAMAPDGAEGGTGGGWLASPSGRPHDQALFQGALSARISKRVVLDEDPQQQQQHGPSIGALRMSSSRIAVPSASLLRSGSLAATAAAAAGGDPHSQHLSLHNQQRQHSPLMDAAGSSREEHLVLDDAVATHEYHQVQPLGSPVGGGGRPSQPGASRSALAAVAAGGGSRSGRASAAQVLDAAFASPAAQWRQQSLSGLESAAAAAVGRSGAGTAPEVACAQSLMRRITSGAMRTSNPGGAGPRSPSSRNAVVPTVLEGQVAGGLSEPLPVLPGCAAAALGSHTGGPSLAAAAYELQRPPADAATAAPPGCGRRAIRPVLSIHDPTSFGAACMPTATLSPVHAHSPLSRGSRPFDGTIGNGAAARPISSTQHATSMPTPLAAAATASATAGAAAPVASPLGRAASARPAAVFEVGKKQQQQAERGMVLKLDEPITSAADRGSKEAGAMAGDKPQDQGQQQQEPTRVVLASALGTFRSHDMTRAAASDPQMPLRFQGGRLADTSQQLQRPAPAPAPRQFAAAAGEAAAELGALEEGAPGSNASEEGSRAGSQSEVGASLERSMRANWEVARQALVSVLLGMWRSHGIQPGIDPDQLRQLEREERRRQQARQQLQQAAAGEGRDNGGHEAPPGVVRGPAAATVGTNGPRNPMNQQANNGRLEFPALSGNLRDEDLAALVEQIEGLGGAGAGAQQRQAKGGGAAGGGAAAAPQAASLSGVLPLTEAMLRLLPSIPVGEGLPKDKLDAWVSKHALSAVTWIGPRQAAVVGPIDPLLDDGGWQGVEAGALVPNAGGGPPGAPGVAFAGATDRAAMMAMATARADATNSTNAAAVAALQRQQLDAPQGWRRAVHSSPGINRW